jgi:hypothetical protein
MPYCTCLLCTYWNRLANHDRVALLGWRYLVPLRKESASNSQAIAKATLSRQSAFLRVSGERARIQVSEHFFVYRRLIVLLGMFLGSYVPVAGQTLAPQIVLSEEHIAPVITTLRTVSIPLPAASFLRPQDLGKSPAYFGLPFAGAYESYDGLLHLSQMVKVKSLMFTSSNLPLVQFWNGRFQLEAFQSTVHMENTQLGPSAYGGIAGFRVPRQNYLGGPLSVHFTGFALSFHFGQDSRTRRPTHPWRLMKQFVGGVLE